MKSYKVDKLKEEIELRRKLMAQGRNNAIDAKTESNFDSETHHAFYQSIYSSHYHLGT